ncbi:imidazolonepropionase [Thermogemmatispora aurantia]|jgi:imidazolonepropionase|uniref:Imidazolonepropionase n=1 Tax=Thermogemmatispora aurantia TaxID=2045279 RepID=A0A5J4KDT2_9CHLR|nr:imidazolonepropionase [Thermogemmatispora aurantia]GER84611.1 imidazolonepropionase [Thermogemmatispora aurantia]
MQAEPVQPPIRASAVIRNIKQLVTVAQRPIEGASGALQVLNNAALAVYHGRIVWIGPDNEAEPLFLSTRQDGITIVDAQGAVVTPGFVDSHTHLVFAGQRAEEFHLRRAGVSYAELLAQGKGILTTVEATRKADAETLLALAQRRLHLMRDHGTTTVEIKSGYGLDRINEEACLHIINNLKALEERASSSVPQQVRVVPTFLAAHVLPLEYRERRADYLDLVVEELLPSFVGLARFCDVFCEAEAFTVEECRRILSRARDLGYHLKIHADQLSPSGGARLAAELGATSADHLDHASDEDLKALRDAGVVATLLPGCSYTLRSPYPSARRLLDLGLTVALATDCNPGTSYCENMQMMIGLAMAEMGMSLEEALIAATINGAKALALEEEIGSIEIGKRCELALWQLEDYREIGYHFGVNLVQSTLTLL